MFRSGTNVISDRPIMAGEIKTDKCKKTDEGKASRIKTDKCSRDRRKESLCFLMILTLTAETFVNNGIRVNAVKTRSEIGEI